MKKETILVLLILIVFKTYGQISNPLEMLYHPIEYKETVEFIADSSKYFNTKLEDSYLQSLGTLYSFLGHYDKAIDLFVIRNKKKGYIPETRNKLDLSALGINQDSLSELYQNFDIVLFNEAHHNSQHRAFLYSQLSILKELGYNQLALEALNEKDTEINKRGYPINRHPYLITGVYTNDPVFGNLIRKALELDFKLIPYESNKINREKGQADNICKRYNSTTGKLIVLAGYGHIEKKFPMMGYYLTKKTKGKIISISQVVNYSLEPIFPDISGYDYYLQYDTVGLFDFHIYYQPQKRLANIPYWYEWMNFKEVKLDNLYDKPIEPNTLIQLFKQNENESVPVYQYLTDGKELVMLAYPYSGAYTLKITNFNIAFEKLVVLE